MKFLILSLSICALTATLQAQDWTFYEDPNDWALTNMSYTGSSAIADTGAGAVPAQALAAACWDATGSTPLTFTTSFLDNNDVPNGSANGIWDLGLFGDSGSEMLGRLRFSDGDNQLHIGVGNIDSVTAANDIDANAESIDISGYDPTKWHTIEWTVTPLGGGSYDWDFKVEVLGGGTVIADSTNGTGGASTITLQNDSVSTDNEVCPNWCAKFDHASGSFIPEPSSALLSFLAVSGFMLRRRR